MWGWRPRATGALAEYYAVARPAGSVALQDAPLLAVDIETTGLNPAKDRVLSMGWVPLDGQRIRLGGAGRILLHTEGAESVGESAKIHGITDQQLGAGVPPAQALAHLLRALQGRAMLAHYSVIEREFLSKLCREHFGAGLRVPVVDTLEIERRHMERMGTYSKGEDLRLPRVRARYRLPQYSSHNALTDALGCAELFLAQMSGSKTRTLKAVLS